MNGKLRPPIIGMTEIVLHRAAFSDEVEIFIGENSYTLYYEPARQWFKAVCQEDYILERVFSYLWNMRSLKYFPQSRTFIPFEFSNVYKP